MRRFKKLVKPKLRSALFVLVSSLVTTVSTAQQIKINEFVLFGGSSGVVISSSSTVQGGSIGSSSIVQTTGKSVLGSNIYSEGTIDLTNSNTITGNIAASNKSGATGNVVSIGSSATIVGNVDAKGNILIGGGSVSGRVTHPSGTTYSGPTPGGGETVGTPNLPVFPAMFSVTNFPAAGNVNITSSQAITPGTYGDVVLTGKKTLTFSGTGDYVFKAISNSGNANNFVFDFKNATSGVIRIYIHGNADLDKINSSLKNGGSAANIYTEVHGTGAGSATGRAFNIANGASGKASKWLGTVWAPNGAINVGSGTGSSDLTGALLSAVKVSVQSGVTINFAGLSDSNVIFPYYPPPNNGKVDDLLGSELNSLYYNASTVSDADRNIFIIENNTVMIEVIAKIGKYDQLLALLQTAPYGLTDIIYNGPNSLVITGRYPIANLLKLDLLPDLIDYCRPLFPPLGGGNTGLTSTNGDKAIHADFIRNGYSVTGEGVKVGVISDSYNTISGNPAGIDVGNGDLPGSTNPYGDLTPVEVVKDYPFGAKSDEGRAMLQIVHDIAPKASLGFRTAFLSSGDFALGIKELAQKGYKVITDDVGYITEPFFTDGQVAQAVDEVTAQGVSYFSAAGNYGKTSYQNTFNATTAPAGFTGQAHDFGGGDIYQNVSLLPGTYTIVLQWEDDVYSLGQSQMGTSNDLDIYLTGPNGAILFGFNRNNLGGDPIEVLPFTVTANTQANILIMRAAGTSAVNLKYLVFRGDLTINEHNSGQSTIVGQANSAGAMTVGAVRYTNTPAFGVANPVAEPFSSPGGTPVKGVVRNKPDFAGPDGVNTTVNFKSLDIEGDNFPNFFGTSAAAPHAAGIAALIIEAKLKFANEAIGPAGMRSLLQSTAVDMSSPGFDFESGFGLINGEAALETFAAPSPVLTSLVVPSGVTPGTTSFTVTVNGDYFTTDTKVLLRGDELTTTFVNSTQLTASVPSFTGNPAVEASTAPKSTVGNDGGTADPLYFFSIVKKKISVVADNQIKKYGEQLPVLTAHVLVDDVPIENTSLTLADLGLSNLVFSTPATDLSNTGQYFIKASRTFDSNDPVDAGLLDLYDYSFTDGVLTIAKMPLKITPLDKTTTFGEKITGIEFNYAYNDSKIDVAKRAAFLANLKAEHQANIVDTALAFVNGKAVVAGRTLTQSDVLGLGFLGTGKAIVASKAIVAGSLVTDMQLVEISLASIFSFQLDSAVGTLVNSKAIVAAKAIVAGKAVVAGKAIVAGPATVNSTNVNDTTNSNVVVIVDSADVFSDDPEITELKAINLITGVEAGHWYIIPAALLSENFEITYGLGTLNILPAPLTVKADDQVIFQKDQLPKFTSTITGFIYGQNSITSGPKYTLSPTYSGAAGLYDIVPSALVLPVPANYAINYLNGTLYVNPKGNGTKNVKPKLLCVDTVIDNSGFNYVAHFSYENPNSTPVFIPIGENNYITALGNYSGQQPELFLPSGGTFDIYFDGNKIQWNVISYNGNQKSSAASDASSTSAKCPPQILSNTRNGNGRISSVSEEATPGVITAYPNPVTNKVRIIVNNGFTTATDLTISDIAGRRYAPKSIMQLTGSSVELDLSGFSSGVYFAKIKINNVFRTFRLIKL